MQKNKTTGTERYKKVIRQRRIFVLSVFAALFVLCICLFTPLFGVTEITVEGNGVLSSEEVISASGIEKGENVFRVSHRKAQKALKGLAYVVDASIQRKFPARIVITINEAKADLIFDTPTEFVVTDISGRVLEKGDDVTKFTAPIVYGVSVTKSDCAQPLEPQDQESYQTHLAHIGCFYSTNFWNDIDEFYVTDITNFMMIMKSGMKVTFGTIESNESLMRKIKMMEQILPQIKQTNKSYLDMTTDKGYFGEYTQDELDEMARRAENGESILDSAKISAEKQNKASQTEEDTTSRKKAGASNAQDGDSQKTNTNKSSKPSPSPSPKTRE